MYYYLVMCLGVKLQIYDVSCKTWAVRAEVPIIYLNFLQIDLTCKFIKSRIIELMGGACSMHLYVEVIPHYTYQKYLKINYGADNAFVICCSSQKQLYLGSIFLFIL